MTTLNMNTFADCKVLIVGDSMLDQYMFGQVFRNSPEANVPVLEQVHISRQLGGAANVAVNIKTLGAQPILLSVCGTDHAGQQLKELLKEAQIQEELIYDTERKTTVKTRVYQDKKQLIRVDQEDKHSLNNEITAKLIDRFKFICDSNKIDLVILQDYNKGVLHSGSIQDLIQYAKERNIFVAVDPKFDNFFEYNGVDLFKPNLKELIQAYQADLPYKKLELKEIIQISNKIKSKIAATTFLVTLSERGALLVDENTAHHKEALSLDVVDVCGAGDAVMSIAALAKLKNFSADKLLGLCVKTGKIVCQNTGVHPIHINELRML